jgi:hypothetical protein
MYVDAASLVISVASDCATGVATGGTMDAVIQESI